MSKQSSKTQTLGQEFFKLFKFKKPCFSNEVLRVDINHKVLNLQEPDESAGPEGCCPFTAGAVDDYSNDSWIVGSEKCAPLFRIICCPPHPVS